MSKRIPDPRIVVQQVRGFQQPWVTVEIPEEWVLPIEEGPMERVRFGFRNRDGFRAWQQSASSVSLILKQALAVIQDTPTLLLTMGPEAVAEYEAAIAKLDRIAAQ